MLPVKTSSPCLLADGTPRLAPHGRAESAMHIGERCIPVLMDATALTRPSADVAGSALGAISRGLRCTRRRVRRRCVQMRAGREPGAGTRRGARTAVTARSTGHEIGKFAAGGAAYT